MHRFGLVTLVLMVPLMMLCELGRAGSQGMTGVGWVVLTRLMQIQILLSLWPHLKIPKEH